MCILQEFDLQIQHSLPSNKCQQEATINFTAVLKTIKQLKQGRNAAKMSYQKIWHKTTVTKTQDIPEMEQLYRTVSNKKASYR